MTIARSRTAEASVLVVLNNSAKDAELRVPLAGSQIGDGVMLEDRLGSAPAVTTHDRVAEVRIAARTATIYR